MLNTLFSPMNIGKLEIPNRTVVTAMVTSYCNSDGTATEKYITYLEAKAKGGWGLIITESYAPSPSARNFTKMAGLWDDSQIESHTELTNRVHKYKSKIFAQICHAGKKIDHKLIADAPQPVAPSAILCKANQDIPQELSLVEIEDLIEKFGDCALRAKKAGFDGVEIHGAHGYLIAQFLTQLSNKRTDEYGGSIYNRLRFALKIVENIRKKAGKDFAISFRISADEFVSGGNSMEDIKVMAMLLEQAGVDVLSISANGCPGFPSTGIQSGIVPHGFLTNYAAEVKKIVKTPIITAGRINNPFLAEEILVSGKADFIGMARASLADPEFPNKAASGRYNEIVECIACMQGCYGRLFSGEDVKCVLNPTLARESELRIKPADVKKKVLIIGGGPSGMEAAITAARAGHEVQLFEKTDRLGGQFYLASIPPGKGEISSFIAWQINQIEKLKIGIHINTEVTLEIIETQKPDVVIVAAGAQPIIPRIPGADRPNVFNTFDVLRGKVSVGEKVLIIGGGLVGAETANYLASYGKSVTLVELLPEIAKDEVSIPREHLIRALEQGKVRILVNTAVKEILSDGVIVKRGETEENISTDTVIIAVGAKPENSLTAKFEGKPYKVVSVGDAVKVRKALEAIEEGYIAGMQV